MLHLTCRHHIHEVILADVIKHCLGPPKNPEIGIFKRFCDKWPSIDKQRFVTALDDLICLAIVENHKTLQSKAIEFTKHML